MAEVAEPPIRPLRPEEYTPAAGAPTPTATPAVPNPLLGTPSAPAVSPFKDAVKEAMAKGKQAAKPAASPAKPATPPPAAAPTTTAAPAAAPAPTDEVLEQPKDSAGWKKLHARIKESETKFTNLSKELEAKSAEIEELKKQPKIDPKELETLKAEKSEMLSRLERVALAEEPLFQARYDKPIEQGIAEAKQLVGTEMASTIEDLLHTPPNKARKAQLADILSQLDNEFDRAALTQAVLQVDKARAERKEALANSKQHWTKLQEAKAAEQARRAAEQQKTTEAQTSTAIEQALKFGSTLSAFTTVDGVTDHNNKIQSRIDRVKNAFTGKVSPEELIRMPVLAAEAEHLREDVIPVLLRQLKERDDTIAQMKTAQPSFESKAAPGAEPTKKWEPGMESPLIAAYKKARSGK